MKPPSDRGRKLSLREIRARAGSLQRGSFHQTVLRYDLAFALLTLAKEPGDFLDLLRSVERKFPTLTFSDFVASAAIAEKAAREGIAEREARQNHRLH
jgi:hypothetical protein